MTSLSSIGYTLGVGAVCFTTCCLAFGVAVHFQCPQIAPRCTARPPNTIYNPNAQGKHAQNRGHVLFGWVKWVYSLSYETLLVGIPGTGTRQGGLAGTLLYVSLDGVVLVRFHAIGRKLALLATLLCLGLLLPLYLTAPCLNAKESQYLLPMEFNLYKCQGVQEPSSRMEDEGSVHYDSINNKTLIEDQSYRQTTLNHVPGMHSSHEQYAKIALRLYAPVLVLWAITIYAFYLLRVEWIEMLGLRRKYYLARENDSYTSDWSRGLNKNNSLQNANGNLDDLPDIESKNTAEEEAEGLLVLQTDQNNERDQTTLLERDPWIPHPEQPDTVPNVEPYTILLGHLPNLIDESLVKPDPEAPDLQQAKQQATRLSRLQQIQNQQRLVTNLMEGCLPQELGYSSPVAAVSIIPCAHQVGQAWRKWYATATKMRRLQLIRSHLQLVSKRQIQFRCGVGSTLGSVAGDQLNDFVEEVANDLAEDLQNAINFGEDEEPQVAARRPLKQQQQENGSSSKDSIDDATTAPNEYFVQALGSMLAEDDLKTNALEFGPEQTAVYGRELAQSASNFCPFGCCEGRIRRSTNLESLQEMEQKASRSLHQSKQELDAARQLFLNTLADVEDESDNDEDDDMPVEIPRHYGIIPPSRRIRKIHDKRGSHHRLSQEDDSSPRQKLRNRGNTPQRKKKKSVTMELPEIRSPLSGNRISLDTAQLMESIDALPTPIPMTPKMRKRRSSSIAWVMFLCVRNMLDPRWWFWCLNEIRLKRWGVIPAAFKELKRESAYAVVTFTSRQAAAAARQSLLQGDDNCDFAKFGMTLHDLPTPPLADAAAWTGFPCRYFCRPVTITLNDIQKNLRLYLILSWLGLMYIFYTIPLTHVASQINPKTIALIFPDHDKLDHFLGLNIPNLLSGLAAGLIWSLFFMLIPQVFKLISYFGSASTSLAQAERKAMQYFWWFMVITAFMGPNLAYWALGVQRNGEKVSDGLKGLLLHLAGATPTLIAPTWLNWIIYRFTIILPINFLLQFNTFFFHFLGCNCCSRMTIGGGPGGPIPYRIFVDSGVVLMCTIALGPASPLVAPAALAYFLFCEPLLRRNVIFVYRPRYDDGGLRWMFCFNMIISALIVGQLLLALQMGLKDAIGAALVSAFAVPTTMWFQWYCKMKYEPAFENTTLLRTNLIDGWDSLSNMTMQKREEHLRFLVDTHKAAYIPVCIAGSEGANILTSTPGTVVPHSIDSDNHHNQHLGSSNAKKSKDGGSGGTNPRVRTPNS